MYPVERRAKIMELVQAHTVVRISQLSREMAVSEATIRRDLAELQRIGAVEVHYGVAQLATHQASAVSAPYQDRVVLHAEEKASIAKAAVRLIDGETSILLDSGSTTAAIARELQTWPDELTVVTTTLNIATLLKANSHLSVIMIGGLLRGPDVSMVGEIAEAMLDRLQIPRAFIGAAGITPEEGVMYAQPLEAEIRRKIIERSNSIVLVADHSKFGRSSLVSVCPLDRVDHVVTGRGLPCEFHEAMLLRRIEVTVVDYDAPTPKPGRS